MPDKFRNIFIWLCCPTGGIHIIHKYESNASILSRVIFYLKSVNFLFFCSVDVIRPYDVKLKVMFQFISSINLL